MKPIVAHRNPLRNVVGRGPWLATVYLFSSVPFGLVFFGVGLAALGVDVALLVTWLALPLLVGTAALIRGAAHVERWRARLVGERIVAPQRIPAGPGLLGMVRGAWRDPGTWRAVACLIVLCPLLIVLDLVAVVLWIGTLAGVTLPIWYWSVPLELADGTRTHGVWLGYPVDTLPVALLTAVGFLVLTLAVAYVVTSAALVHRAVVRSLLGPRLDPLRDAKRMLAEPGPLNASRVPGAENQGEQSCAAQPSRH